jgi:hypothetical protein
VALVSRLRLNYLQSKSRHSEIIIALYLFLAAEAYLFNRLMGGLPYPIWRPDPHIENIYHSLAGRSSASISRWQKLANKTFQRR